MQKEDIRKIIVAELDKMRTIMESAPDKMNEIISEFNEQTINMLHAVDVSAKIARFSEAASVLHKLKVRYSYFGFEDVYEKLQRWENSLKIGVPIPGISDEIQQIVADTQLMIEVLKTIDPQKLTKDSDENLYPLVGKKILVAEDDEINALVFESYIQELGGEILMAHDGFEAINQVTESAPDLIFMDVHMPYCNGLDAIKTLRNRGITTPIISLSASSRLNERDESLQAGANDFLTKPANRHAIKQALLKHIA